MNLRRLRDVVGMDAHKYIGIGGIGNFRPVDIAQLNLVLCACHDDRIASGNQFIPQLLTHFQIYLVLIFTGPAAIRSARQFRFVDA